MDRRLLLRVAMSSVRELRMSSRTQSKQPAFCMLAATVALLLLVSLCGCGGSARQPAPMPSETSREEDSSASESRLDDQPGAKVEIEQPVDEKKVEPDAAAEEPSDVKPGAKLEYRLPDAAAAEEMPTSAEPDGPLAPMTASVPERAVPPGFEKSGEDIPKFAAPKPDSPVAEPKAGPEAKSGSPAAKTRTRTQADKGFTRVRVFYATDRQRGGDTPNEFYTDQRRFDETAPPLDLGCCEVSVPYKHDPGEIERPSVWRMEFRENPAKHVVLMNVQPVPVSRWQAEVRDEVSASEDKAALVFVHGFNVDFASAARRTAQMKYDLDFHGAAILYSWPAPSNYIECEGNAIWTLPHLMEFLTEYVQTSGAVKIHLVAHSLGTRVLTTALRELASSPAAAAVRYNQIILAAPDIDAAVFKEQIAPRIVNVADRISIYSSSQDWALVASKKAHRYRRLGEGGDNLTTFPEWPVIEVLDATHVDESLLGHSYYGDSPTILRDVRGVLAGASAVARGLRAQASYYLFAAKRNTLSQQPK